MTTPPIVIENPDILFDELRQAALNNDLRDWQQDRNHMEVLVEKHMDRSQMTHVYKKFTQAINSNPNVRILDYGCGGGQFIFYLLFLGFRMVHGIDVSPQLAVTNNLLAQKLNFAPDIFTSYDRKNLPFDDASFDIIISQQVLEHVHNLDDYYKEAARVLVPGGVVLLDFPHRLIPYDSHSRCWFIHYFPYFFRKILYNKFTPNGFNYFEKVLNFKTLHTHKHIALKYFSSYRNTTYLRLQKNSCVENYEGNIHLRRLANIVMQLPLLGPLATRLIAFISIADIELHK